MSSSEISAEGRQTQKEVTPERGDSTDGGGGGNDREGAKLSFKRENFREGLERNVLGGGKTPSPLSNSPGSDSWLSWTLPG